jgi:hypothetical protein
MALALHNPCKPATPSIYCILAGNKGDSCRLNMFRTIAGTLFTMNQRDMIGTQILDSILWKHLHLPLYDTRAPITTLSP